ncbi:CAP domain-containing protein [Silvibacterium acidisoli]|uniref:CAP domain-containing protein n=1 Tax=Acidobacteriaceae bacterium ZG23-2 TaxID=2883246 RepID=UPI00406D4DF2
MKGFFLTTLAAGALFAGTLSAQSDSKAQQILDLTNKDREAHSLPPLKWDDALAAAAQKHAERMIQEKTLSHQYDGEPDPGARAAQAGAHFQAVAENIAMGYSPEAIEKEWMNSVPHRTNILDPQMNAIGIGVAQKGGYYYAVEDFSNATQQMGANDATKQVADLVKQLGVDPSGPANEAQQACESDGGVPNGVAAKAVIRFQTPDISKLPDQVADKIHTSNLRKAAVATCKPTQNGSFTMYRVAILLY